MPTPLWIGGFLEYREGGGDRVVRGGGKPRDGCHITALDLVTDGEMTKSCRMAREIMSQTSMIRAFLYNPNLTLVTRFGS